MSSALGEAEFEHIDSKKKLLLADFSEPDGNLYRGWAVGIENWNRNLFVMTLLVMLAQILGPLFTFFWAFGQIRYGTLWYAWNPNAKWTYPSDLMDKILGTVLLLIVFVNAANILRRQQYQHDRLRQLFDELKIGWIHLESFCTAWCVSLCCIAVVPMMWLETDIKGIILDCFGLLFLTNLHEYGGTIQYGIEPAEFDSMIQELSDTSGHGKKVKWTRGGVDGKWTRQHVDLDVAERLEKYHWFKAQLLYGDIYYALGGLVTSLAFCYGATAFVFVKFIPSEDPNKEWLSGGVLNGYGLVFAPLLFACLLLWRFYHLCRDPKQKHDIVSFVYYVLLSRPDPRQVQNALASASFDLNQMTLELGVA